MKKLLTFTAAAGLVAASTATALACPYSSASMDKKMTVAEAPVKKGEEAMSTFDPDKVVLEEENNAE